MGHVLPLFRRSSVARDRLIQKLTSLTERARLLVRQGLDASRRDLKTRLRRLHGKLRFLLGQRKLIARMPGGGSRSLHGRHSG